MPALVFSRPSAFIITFVLLLAGCDSKPPAGASAAAPASDSAGAAQGITLAQLAQAKPGGSCALDHINGVIDAKGWSVSRKTLASIVGWVTDGRGQAPAHFTLVLQADAAYGFAGHTGVERKDVAQALGNGASATAGYAMTADLAALTPGAYAASIVSDAPGGAARCDLSRQITVTP